MIVRYLDFIRVAIREPETDTPLVVDRYGVEIRAIAFERMQTVAGGNLQIIKPGRVVDILQLSDGSPNDIGRKPFGPSGRVKFPGGGVRKSLNHVLNVNYHVTLVKRRISLDMRSSLVSVRWAAARFNLADSLRDEQNYPSIFSSRSGIRSPEGRYAHRPGHALQRQTGPRLLPGAL